MESDEHKKLIFRELEKAIVKIFVPDEFKGTGFFITLDGYLLTAYHCLGAYPEIVIKTNFGKEFKAKLEEAKSSKLFDIAVLKVEQSINISIPLGVVSKEHVFDDIVALGYPAGNRDDNQQIGTYHGKISKFRDDYKIENDVIKGPGQSGGPIYHYATRHVIGVALQGYKNEVMTNTALAARFNPLFDKWPELESINNEVAKAWEEQLRKLLPKTNNDSKATKGQTIKQQTIHQEGANITGSQVNIVGDVGSFSMSAGSK